MVLTQIQKDNIVWAEKEEKRLKDRIEKKFNCSLELTSYWDPFDYIDEEKKIILELKSRKNKRYKYPTTIIGNNKIIEGRKYKKKGYMVVYIFNFTDNLSYIKLSNFKNFKIDNGGIQKYKKYCYIDVDLLEDISEV